jgi:hypothetical protein
VPAEGDEAVAEGREGERVVAIDRERTPREPRSLPKPVLRDGELGRRRECELVVRRAAPRATERLVGPAEPGGVAGLPRELLVAEPEQRE